MTERIDDGVDQLGLVKGLPDHCRNWNYASEDGNQSKRETEHKLCVVAVAHTVVDEWTMVIHPLDASIASLAMVTPGRLVSIAGQAVF